MSGPFRVFISYSHADGKYCEALKEHLTQLRRDGLIDLWQDRRISPGQDWKKEIEANLEAADLVLLLVSQSFIASEYCIETEMKRALERHANGEIQVVPIVVRPCDWTRAPIGKLQCLPKDGRAISSSRNRDKAWLDVVIGLRQVIEQLQTSQAKEAAADSAGRASTGTKSTADSSFESRCGELLDRARDLLVQEKELRRELAAHIKTELRQDIYAWPDDDLPDLLADLCKDLKTSQLLRIFLEVSRRISRLDGLEEAFSCLIPIVYWNEIDRYRAKISKDWMRLPVVVAAYADFVQAAYDGRKLELFLTPSAGLRSKLALNAPRLPENSISEQLSYEDLVDHLQNELVGKSLYRESLLRKEHFEVTQQMPVNVRTAQRAGIINRQLEREQRERNRIYFLLVDKGTYMSYGPNAEKFLLGFKALLPALRIVILEGDWEKSEEEKEGLGDLVQLMLSLSSSSGEGEAN